MFQCCVWNTWGPVVNVVKVVFPSWSQGTISLLANWTAIAFLVFLVPVLYLQNRSLRSAILLTSSLIALGTSVRCMFLVLPDISDKDFTLLCHLGAILNGIPSIVVTSAPPAVSSAWFPPDERVTATSIRFRSVQFLCYFCIVFNLKPFIHNHSPKRAFLFYFQRGKIFIPFTLLKQQYLKCSFLGPGSL